MTDSDEREPQTPASQTPAPQTPAPQTPAPQTPPADRGIHLTRSWAIVGASVTAFALVGLGFGLGYITGDQVGDHGDHGDRGPKHMRGEFMMRGDTGQLPGNEFGPGRRWRGVPPDMQPPQSTTPAPQSTTPAPQTSATPG